MMRRTGFLLGFFLATASLLGISRAALAEAVVQSYKTTSPLQAGTIVELVGSSPAIAEPLPQAAADKMFGVVINPAESPVSLSSTNDANQAFVATNDNYSVLVSNQNGSIKTGDYVTISSITGVGMKATSADKIVLGKALAAFNGGNDSIGSTTLKESGGQQKTVQFGRAMVGINIIPNPLIQDTVVPSFLRTIAQGVSSRPVSAVRVYLSLAVLLADAVITGSLLYAGVRSSLIAIGRNPLSKKSIVRGLIQVTLTSLIVFIIGLFAVYLLLRF